MKIVTLLHHYSINMLYYYSVCVCIYIYIYIYIWRHSLLHEEVWVLDKQMEGSSICVFFHMYIYIYIYIYVHSMEGSYKHVYTHNK